jgi:hypothetical protein
MDTLPSGEPQVGGFRSALARVRLSLACPFRLLHTFHLLRPARHYPRVRIWRSSFERQRDFNPPEQRAAQRTLRHSPTALNISRPPYGLWPSRTGLAVQAKTSRSPLGSRACCFSACPGSKTTQDRTGHSRFTWLSCCLPPTGMESASWTNGFSKLNIRPTNTSVYASVHTLRCTPQDSRPGWTRYSPFL